MMQELDMPEHLHYIDKRLAEENERVMYYLDSSKKLQLIVTVERQLITEHVTGILQRALGALVEENRIPDLTLIYQLFSRVKDRTKDLCPIFNAYIKN